jgi:hypothetical protein
MKNTFLRGFILLFVFCIAFFITTVVSDLLDKHDGYYDQGIADSREVGR